MAKSLKTSENHQICTIQTPHVYLVVPVGNPISLAISPS